MLKEENKHLEYVWELEQAIEEALKVNLYPLALENLIKLQIKLKETGYELESIKSGEKGLKIIDKMIKINGDNLQTKALKNKEIEIKSLMGDSSFELISSKSLSF